MCYVSLPKMMKKPGMCGLCHTFLLSWGRVPCKSWAPAGAQHTLLGGTGPTCVIQSGSPLQEVTLKTCNKCDLWTFSSSLLKRNDSKYSYTTLSVQVSFYLSLQPLIFLEGNDLNCPSFDKEAKCSFFLPFLKHKNSWRSQLKLSI